MKKYLWLFIFFFIVSANAQKNNATFKITYLRTSNGSLIENQEPILVYANQKESVNTNQKIINKTAEFPFETFSFTKDKPSQYATIAQLNSTKSIATVDSVSLKKQTFELLSEKKTILGYECKKARTSINSNTIEIWYTDALKINASPNTLGQTLGLVLEINRNGNFVISATKIEKLKEFPSNVRAEIKSKDILDILTYKDLVWKSRFTTIPIFKNEVINFSSESISNDSIMRFANGTVILRKVKIPAIAKGSQVFIDVTEQSNGDAYDRTGSVFMIPMDKKTSFLNGLQNDVKSLPVYENGNGKQYQGIISTDDYTPLLELMRFFTPFGIKHFNTIELKDKTWEEQVNYRQDISELTAAFNNKEVYIGTFIGNYDKGGHKVSVNITIHPEENGVSKASNVIPLFNTTNVMEMAGQEYGTLFNSDKGLFVKFTLAKDLKNAKIRYTTTGHGGWENGDEFVPKKNTLLLDEKEVYHFTPWREDCGSYRLYNPASGNFPNGLSSSDYSRSNWCPGMVTIPVYIELGDLKAGTHTLQVKIPQGANEGTTFSSWNVSGVLLGE